MSTKAVVTWIVVIVIVLLGGYFVYKSMGSGSSAPTQDTSGAAGSATTTDQVQGQDVTVGTGAQATPGSQVSVLYVGYVGQISSSTIFDSSAAHGNQPLTLTLGQPGIIPGFQIGVNGMKVGGERLLAIPPSLGYGAQAVHQNPQDPSSPVVIPANSTLIFDVKLVSVKASSSTPATTPAAPTAQ